jgi:hypothetical protein
VVIRGRPGKILLTVAVLTAALWVPGQALALSCVFFPFQAPGERFGSKELLAHVEVLEIRADRAMDVRILRILHGREERPIVSVDIAGVLGWKMPQQWGFEPFSQGTQWLIVLRPGQDGRASWQPQLCRAFLKVEGRSAVGYVSDLTRRERVPLEALAAGVASPQHPAGPTD